jgi:cobalt-zinc-cadmium efflux system protein
MGHHHEHGHRHGPASYDRAFGVGIALNVGYVACEAAFGLWNDSLALLADAGHNASDVIGLLLAWGGYALAKVGPSERRTYGWRGTSILAALFNALLLLAAVGAIVWEAVRRFREPQPVPGGTLMWVAGVGVAVNAATAWLFFAGRKGDLNIRGAFLHMAADAGVSLGVVLAGLVILRTGLTWVDPVASLLVAGVVFVGTWGLLRESVNLAIQAVPEGIDLAEVRGFLAGLPGVAEVHDLHVWAMSTTEVALTAHLVKPDPAGDDEFLARAAEALHDRFGIEHTTIQIERGTIAGCRQAPEGAV